METKEIINKIMNFQTTILAAKDSSTLTGNSKDLLKQELSRIINDVAKVPNDFLIEVSVVFRKMVSKCQLDIFFGTEIVYSYLANHINAFSLQINWHLEELSAQLSETKKMIRKYLNLKNPHFFSFRSASMKNKKQYLGKKAYLKLKFFLVYVETLLQHTAVLSQQGKHKDALEKASECFKTLKVELSYNL